MKQLSLTTIYTLRDDTERIAATQQATLSTTDFGLKSTHGLFGSEEWWQKIERGELTTHVAEGMIAELSPGPHGDYPEFMLVSEGGKSFWAQIGDSHGYQVGKRARISYVLQKLKTPPVEALTTIKIVLTIEIER